jgi:tRNA(fMet)-specific endonuclease VapC
MARGGDGRGIACGAWSAETLSQTYVLDTSTVLNLLRGKELGRQIDAAFSLASALHRQTISIVTHGELKALAERNSWGQSKRQALSSALNNLVTLDIDSDALVDAYVRIEEACRSTVGGERKMGQNDMWIAATALMTGLSLITTDKDFSHLNGRVLTVHWVDPTLNKTV